MAAEATIRKAVRDYFAALSALDAAAYAAAFTEDGVAEDPVGTPAHRGRDALRRFMEGLAGMFREAQVTPDEVFVAGDGAAVRWTVRGTSTNGRAVTFSGIDVFEVDDDGSIRSVRGYWDAAAVMAQTG